jgi:mono/diheme cytochrome c family protein
VVERQSSFGWVLIVGSALWIGCSEEPPTTSAGSAGSGVPVTVPTPGPAATPAPTPTQPVSPAELSPEELIEAGRSVYNANCIACHSLDPTKDGALGPAVAGSSLALLDARVLRAEYPEGYEAKRPTRVMIALPHLEPRLIELAAYLGSLE